MIRPEPTALHSMKNEFKVIALDEAGRPKGTGGDECVVHVHRCGEVVRVKTSDNGDGSYAVSFNPDTSGEYSIDISVGGVPLTGSPHVEIRFKDVLGNTAHAADVDVYAEPVDSLDLAEAEEELGLPGWLRTGQPASPRSARGGAAYGSALHSPRPAHEGVHTAKVKVPLVVRVGVGTDSERVGQVRAGRTVYLL
ncbi:tripartite motif-containing protein 45 [Chrysochromulina tobinii]|uniref:Tripartite motif-containing protein 45 n=1 Tax=Chrysochromulina tobinii TaxID=1460289 RepID=A0A0M0JNB2_9EUKA|nr:tripartite motif-containing protein 45 [Chrysochromulina tobinii]|eukprot:KOO27812.1 tripartite motif-containing protein 45 [Chrysochromulina sp. CCMP291]